MVSIELPEAKILAEQMNRVLRGKRILFYRLNDYERLQRIGFLNKDLSDFNQLVDGVVESALSRGNAILVKLDNGMNLLLNPEYGGETLFTTNAAAVPAKYHLRVDFADDSVLTIRLTSMGGFYALKNGELTQSYIFRRDFNPAMLSPIDEEFTLERFASLLTATNRGLKSVLVGKDAVLVGLGNSAFQDIMFRARLHPKRKASDLNAETQRALHEAIQLVLRERLRLKGKAAFSDLYGNQGSYIPAMGPNMKHGECPTCRTPIERLSVGGGHVYFCPTCQV